MDCSLTENEVPLYRVWLHSPSVFGSETETILAFKIAREMGAIPSRVLKALRAQAGVDPDLLKQVETFVQGDANLMFVDGENRRTIALVNGRD